LHFPSGIAIIGASTQRDTALRFATFVAEQGGKMSRRRHNAAFLDGFVRGLISITIHATGAVLFDQIVFVNPFCERKPK
jgi:hypothetical protein